MTNWYMNTFWKNSPVQLIDIAITSHKNTEHNQNFLTVFLFFLFHLYFKDNCYCRRMILQSHVTYSRFVRKIFWKFLFIPGHRLASSPQWRRGQLCQWLGQLCLGVCAEPGGQVRLMGFRGLDGEHCPPNALPLSGAGQSSSFLHPCQRLWRLPTLFKSGDKVMRNLVETPHQRDKKSHSPHLSLPARKG